MEVTNDHWPPLASPSLTRFLPLLASHGLPGFTWPPMASWSYLATPSPPGLTWTSPSGLHWYHLALLPASVGAGAGAGAGEFAGAGAGVGAGVV